MAPPFRTRAPAEDEASLAFARYRRSGDPRAAGELFDRTAAELMGLAAHLAPGLAAAEDLLQETFLVALRKAKRWDPARPVTPWLAGILLGEARKERRRRGRRVDADRLGLREPEDGLREALVGEVRGAVERAMAEVPAAYREVVEGSLLGGETAPALARRLGRAPGTVRVQLHRGLDHLRRALPAGIGLGALAALFTRGLGQVRGEFLRQAALTGPALATTGGVAGAGLLHSLTGIAMGTSTKVLAAAAVALGIGITLLGAELGPPADDPADVLVADRQGEGPRDVGALDPVGPPGPERSRSGASEATEAPAAAAPETPASPASRSIRIDGELVLGAGQLPPEFQLEVRAGAGLDRIQRTSLPGPGRFSLDVTELVGDDDPGSIRMMAMVTGEGHIPASVWCTRPETLGNGDVVFEVGLEPTAVLRTITGRLVQPDGTAVHPVLSQPWVAFLPHRLDEPAELQHLDFAPIGPDGAFELRLTSDTPGTLLYTAVDRAVGHRDTVEDFASGANLVECGDLVLPRGASIAGTATEDGLPMAEGGVVIATSAYAPTPWTMLSRRLRLVGGRAIHAEHTARIDADGRFELTGLESGVEYTLVAVPGSELRGRVVPAIEEGTGLGVRAPAVNVSLASGTVPVSLRVTAGGEPAQDIRVKIRMDPADRRRALPDALVRGLIDRAPAASEIRLRCAADRLTRLDVSARGFEAEPLDLDPAALPVDGIVEVELGRGHPMADVRVTVRMPGGPEPLRGASCFLLLYGGAAMERLGPVPMKNGVALFEEVPSGPRYGRLSISASRALPPEDLPLVRLAGLDVQLPAFEDDGTVELEVTPEACGRIELRLVGRDPDHAPSFELVESTGNVVRPPLIVPKGAGHAETMRIDGDGPYLLGAALPPGRYEVRQTADAYLDGAREVDVVAGEVTRITVQLEPR